MVGVKYGEYLLNYFKRCTYYEVSTWDMVNAVSVRGDVIHEQGWEDHHRGQGDVRGAFYHNNAYDKSKAI